MDSTNTLTRSAARFHTAIDWLLENRDLIVDACFTATVTNHDHVSVQGESASEVSHLAEQLHLGDPDQRGDYLHWRGPFGDAGHLRLIASASTTSQTRPAPESGVGPDVQLSPVIDPAELLAFGAGLAREVAPPVQVEADGLPYLGLVWE